MDENKKAASEDKEPMDTQATEKAGEKKPGRISAASSKRGMYTAAVSALVVAIVIIFNLLVGSLPAGTLQYDITSNDMYTVTEQSMDYLKTLDKDVRIVVLAQSAAIDQQLLKFINNYARLSSHIKLQIIDPVLDPTALTTYSAKENQVIVQCEATDKTKTLALAGIIDSQSGTVYSDGMILYDAQAYQYGQLSPVALDAEGQLTSAVDYVTSTATNKLFLLTGHGEATLGTDAADAIAKVNIDTASLNLLTAKTIPADCQVILCYNPTNDITGDELNTLETFLRAGGKMMLILDNTALTNFNTLLADYGLQMQSGFVGDNDRYYQSLYIFLPVLSASSDVTAEISNLNVLVQNTHAMLQVTPLRRGSSVTSFMTTSGNGILADSQKTGEYILGAVATESFADNPDIQTRFTVITSLDLVSDGLPSGLANLNVFTNAVIKNFKEVQNVSIPSKSLSVQPITIANPVPWIVLFVVLIPVVLIVSGLVTWIKRRNR
jgi:ABC-2 type transport system permease protein